MGISLVFHIHSNHPNSLLENAPNQQTIARLLAVSNFESGVWLNALPITVLGLHIEDVVSRVAV